MGDYGDAMWQSIVAAMVVVVILGWALIEFVIYLFKHISISWVP